MTSPSDFPPPAARATHATPAIPADVDATRFLADPVSDQLVRVVMELGAALWVERRRTRVLERVLVDAGLVAPDAVEQWVNAPDDAAADREELDLWTRRIFGPLTKIGAADGSAGTAP
jgi:hypothetical protein